MSALTLWAKFWTNEYEDKFLLPKTGHLATTFEEYFCYYFKLSTSKLYVIWWTLTYWGRLEIEIGGKLTLTFCLPFS